MGVNLRQNRGYLGMHWGLLKKWQNCFPCGTPDDKRCGKEGIMTIRLFNSVHEWENHIEHDDVHGAKHAAVLKTRHAAESFGYFHGMLNS